MDPLQIGVLLRYATGHEMHSALPGAPVVLDDAARWVRSRAAAAAVLRRVADAVAPEPALGRPRLNAAS
jgi:hypothetical protein